MKHLRWTIIMLLVLLPALGQAADDGYGYPIPGSYGATILGTPDSLKPELPESIPVRELVLDVIPGLENRRFSFTMKGCDAPLFPRIIRPL